MDSEIKLKGLIDNIMNGINELLNSQFFQRLLSKFITEEYNKGLDRVEDIFEINFIKDPKDLSYLMDYVNGLVKQTTDQINQDLKAEIQRASMDGKNDQELRKIILEKFSDKKYINRYNTIVRTEGQRANNYSQLQAVKRSGLNVKKYLSVNLDDSTSEICRKANKLYGSEDKAIPLDEEFVIKTSREDIATNSPPFHPNCRTTLMFTDPEGD